MLADGTRWHLDADVIVIGYGAAGVTAALAAHDAGAQVLILEKQAKEIPLSNSFMSAGRFICPSDEKAAQQYMEALYAVDNGLYWTDRDIIKAWVENTVQNKEWLESMGVTPPLVRHGGENTLVGAESIDVYSVPGGGSGMMKLLYEQVKQRNIQVMYGMRARNLLVNAGGEVVGVRVLQQNNQAEVNVRCRRSVVLATGGFEFNEEMKLQYLKVYPSYFDASPELTGDGVTMGLEVGCQLWHMNCCVGQGNMKFPEVVTGMKPNFGSQNWVSPGISALPQFGGRGEQAQQQARSAARSGYILTDRYGRRYTNENVRMHVFYYELTLFDTRRSVYPRVPSYWVFDQTRMENGPLPGFGGSNGAAGIYKWSMDNSEELERGWITSGRTVTELARKLDMNIGVLKETVNNYNGYCEGGVDTEYEREPDTLIPLNRPPYYAVKIWPGGVNTQGGPRRNARAQVLRADGEPVPRLYGAGELGSMYGMLYPAGGGNLAECFAFGRIAGEGAARCRPL